MDKRQEDEPAGLQIALRPDERIAEAADKSFDRAVATIIAEKRMPSLSDDASDLDIFEIATAILSEK